MDTGNCKCGKVETAEHVILERIAPIPSPHWKETYNKQKERENIIKHKEKTKTLINENEKN